MSKPRQDRMVPVMGAVWRRLPSPLRRRVALLLLLGLTISFSQIAVVTCIAVLGAALAAPGQVATLPVIGMLAAMLPEAGGPALLVQVCALTLAAVTANSLLRALNEFFGVSVGREVERHVGAELLEGFMRMPYEWFLSHNTSDLVMNIYWATHHGAVARQAVSLLGEAASIAAILGGVFFMAPTVSIGAMAAAALLSILIFRLLRRKLDHYSARFRESSLDRQRLLNVAMQGIKDVKIFGSEDSLAGWSDDRMNRCVRFASRQELVRSAPAFLLEPIGFLVILGLVVFMVRSSTPSANILGTASLMAAAGWKILPCINKVLSAVVNLRTSWPYLMQAERLLAQVQEHDAQQAPQEGCGPLPGFEADLKLDAIGFRYAGSESVTLESVDFAVRKGEVVGVVGRSGAGKSTLINILVGLLKPSCGAIRIDGEELTPGRARAWQVVHIGYVPQSPYILDASLAENIAFGQRAEQIDLERVLRCCAMAAIDFLDRLPDGVWTQIGERGLRLSGGQQQRVAIARALYKDPDIIIFDEATSSLDTASEKEIQQTIYGLRGTKTLIVVAHRLSTVQSCDRVYWIDGGCVRRQGLPTDVLQEYAMSCTPCDSPQQ